jgi:hypothetical protein
MEGAKKRLRPFLERPVSSEKATEGGDGVTDRVKTANEDLESSLGKVDAWLQGEQCRH